MTLRTLKRTGVILYEGPSMLDGAPIICIATGLSRSRNTKTGNMIQTWILRADVHPKSAILTGQDASICGACPHRGHMDETTGKLKDRSCYVRVHQAPASVYRTYLRGRYEHVTPADAATLFADRVVRLGAYGDPAAVPFWVWRAALSQASLGPVAPHTGYTHQWREFPEFAQYCMASCDSPSERLQAKFLGFRTFRVAARGETAIPGEVVCPASKEAGHKTTCDSCRACGGITSKARADIVIAAHGAGAAAFTRRSIAFTLNGASL